MSTMIPKKSPYLDIWFNEKHLKGRICFGTHRVLGYWTKDCPNGPKGAIRYELDEIDGRMFPVIYVHPIPGETWMQMKHRAEKSVIKQLKRTPEDKLSWLYDVPSNYLNVLSEPYKGDIQPS